MQRPGFDLWHHADAEFGQPRTNFHFAMLSPIANDSPRHAVLGTLLARVTNDALNEFAYPAALAGQSYALYRHGRGITARLSGWSDKQALLLERIVSTLRAPPLSLPRFEAEKAEYARQLRNAGERAPHRRAIQDVRELLIDPAWSAEALLAALDTVGIEDLREYVPNFFKRGEIVALAHGNVTAGAAQALGSVLERGLLASMHPARAPLARVVRLDPGARYVRQLASAHEDHALAVYLQGRGRGFPERAKAALLAQAMGNRFFHELRTEREIGYTVYASPMPLRDVPGLALVVQSPSTPPEAIHRQMDAFLGRFGAALREMPRVEFERHRAALESTLLEADTRLGETHRAVLERHRPRALHVRPARAARRSGARRHSGRSRGDLAGARHRPGIGPRRGRGRLRPGIGRLRRPDVIRFRPGAPCLRPGVRRRGDGGGPGRLQTPATLFRRRGKRVFRLVPRLRLHSPP